MANEQATPLRLRQAIVAALEDEMDADPSVMIMGEDIAVAGGPFKTSEGLLERFGPNWVRDTPISEMGFTGAGVGAAIAGLRPVVEIMFMEFLGVALDQLVTGAAEDELPQQGQRERAADGPRFDRLGSGFGSAAQPDPGELGHLDPRPRSSTGEHPAERLRPAALGHPRAGPDDRARAARALRGARCEVVRGEDGIVLLGKAEIVRVRAARSRSSRWVRPARRRWTRSPHPGSTPR